VVRLPLCIEGIDHGLQVTHRRASGVGIASVGDHLHFRQYAGKQPALEFWIDLNDQERASIVDVIGNVASPSEIGHPIEHAGAVEFG
jgi:hypothetical protein